MGHPLWAETLATLEANSPQSISLDAYETWTGLMRLLAYGLTFLLFFNLHRARARAELTLTVFGISAIFYAGYGLFIVLSHDSSILWFEKWAYPDDVTSTFVNKNSYATYASFGLITLVFLLIQKTWKNIYRHMDWKTSFRSTVDSLSHASWIWIVGIFIVSTSLLLSNSRAGVVSGVSGIFYFLTVGFLTKGRLNPVFRYVSIMVVLLLVATIYVSSDVFISRLDRLYAGTDDLRYSLWRETVVAIAQNPLFGSGLGTYEEAFRLYRTLRIPFHFRLDLAHNTYLELAFEIGLVAATALVASVLALAVHCFLAALRGGGRAWYGLLGGSICVTAGLHSAADFSLQIPAIAVTFAALMGICVAQSFPRSENSRQHRSARGELAGPNAGTL